ncbi:MAG: rRNA maturation RNase YbeY [Alphaproteobacteria bacterium]|jgi:probable rRNA maturation factor|nr:rRNA maturation RNase YbeY [Alphaproteobacteria bacterium]
MPDPDPSIDIVVILDKPCWERPLLEWESLIQPVVLQTLQEARWKMDSEINVLLTDNHAIQNLNKTYLGKDKPTNVLSFPSLELAEIATIHRGKGSQIPVILGDVALAFETIQEEAVAQNKSFDHHLTHLVVHGVLHLLGYDHENDEDAAAMETLEIKILTSLLIPNPYQERP